MHKVKGNYSALQYMYTCACKESTVSSSVVSSLEVEHLCLELMGERGDRNIRDKNIRESGSGTLRNTVTWLLCSSVRLVGYLTVDEFFSVLYAVARL